MCAACVAQGVGYVGASLAGLRVMTARAQTRRLKRDAAPEVAKPTDDEPTPTDREPATV
jgi:hypothetical protein